MNNLKTPGLNPLAVVSLADAAKWAKFIAIVGFVAAGLLFIFSFFAGSIMSKAAGYSLMPHASGVVLTIVYLFAAALEFALCFFLFKFARKTQDALASGEEGTLAEGLEGLKTYFTINGVILCIVLGILALSIIVGIVAGIVAAVR